MNVSSRDLRAAKDQTSLRSNTASSESSLIDHTKFGCKGRLMPKYSYLAALNSCIYMFKERLHELL